MRQFLASQLVLNSLRCLSLCVCALESKIKGMLFSINLRAPSYVHVASHLFVLFCVCEAESARE